MVFINEVEGTVMETQMEKRASVFSWITGLALLIGVSLQAQQTPGVTFLQMSVGSRAQAMGEAFTAVASSANGVHYNPAGMGFGLNRELMFYHSRWFQDISVENVTFLYPFNSRWSIGSSISYLHVPQFTRYEVDPLTGGPVENGTFSVYDLVFLTGIGFRVTDDVALGANLKLFQEQLESVSARGFAVDLGLLTRVPHTGLRMGLAVQHLGPAVKYMARSELLPLTYRGGLAYQFRSFNGLIALDVAKTIGKDIQFLPGMELGLTNSFYLRGGYQVADNLAGSGMAAGFGLRLLDDHQVNYVYVPYGDLGDTHRAELILHLGSVPSEKELFKATPQSNKPMARAKEILNKPEPPKTVALPEPKPRPVETPRPAPETKIRPADKLSPPSAVTVSKLPDGKMKLSWNAASNPGVAYNIYAKPAGGTRWIKITTRPIEENQQLFTQRKSNLSLLFVVTSVRGDEESDFSDPAILKLP